VNWSAPNPKAFPMPKTNGNEIRPGDVLQGRPSSAARTVVPTNDTIDLRREE